MDNKKINKIGVFGGGGALGAYTAGVLSVRKPDYDMCVGTSTGALLSTMAVLGKYDQLSQAYQSITPGAIFNRNPFKKNGKINIRRATWRLGVLGKVALADTKKMTPLIKKYYTPLDHQRLRNMGKKFVVTAVRVKPYPARLVYFDSSETDYETMVQAIRASCSVPFAMTPVKILGEYFSDGGMVEVVPFNYAHEHYPKAEKDVYVHFVRREQLDSEWDALKNALTNIATIQDVGWREISENDLSKIPAGQKVNYLPYDGMTNNSLNFDKETMARWFKMGQGIALNDLHDLHDLHQLEGK